MQLIISGVPIAIEALSTEAHDRLAECFSPWIVPSDGIARQAATFRVQNFGRPQLWANSSMICESADWHTLLLTLLREMEWVVIRELRGRAVIHAGAAAIGTAGIILPGSSRSGKTSLVREMIRQGGEYLSDEYAVIDAHGALHPFVRPLVIRTENAETLTPPRELGAVVGSMPRNPACILFLEYQPGARFEIREMNRSTSVLRLLANTPHQVDQEPHLFSLFHAAARGARAFEGIRGEAHEAANCIAELVTRNV